MRPYNRDPEPTCAWCEEPFLEGGEAQRFCITCDDWLHMGCLERHARCEPDGEGDWKHMWGDWKHVGRGK